jgi:4-hydroxybutyrate CoA-transferase
MIPWKDHVRQHTLSLEQAASLVKSGDVIVLSHACGEPKRLPGALVEQADRLHGVKIVHMVAMGPAPYCQKGFEDNFRHIALFAGGSTRVAIQEGRADYLPCFFYQIPDLFGTVLPIDVAMITVSPPDNNGYCSLGISVDYTRKAVQEAKVVIAEVNPNMPRTHGESFIHADDINYFVNVDEPLYELTPPRISEVECAIGHNVAELIDDEACLQLGIGGIPDAVLANLNDFKNLGIHSEMISNGVKDLVEKGVITCSKKTLHPGKIVVTFMMGTQPFYQWTDDNPMIEMHPVDYVNNPYVIGKNDQMISINSAIEVDLLGQVCADTMGGKQFSGVGGQVDFVRGARLSIGGKAIIALPSTAKNGEISRIAPFLKQGSAVTTSRNEVDYVVTEYGIAALRGATTRERAQSLIKIADPRFQEELSKAAREIYGLWI